MIYRHNKTGHLYLKLLNWINCTNGSEEDEVIYIRLKFNFMIFHRKKSEFHAKFTKIF